MHFNVSSITDEPTIDESRLDKASRRVWEIFRFDCSCRAEVRREYVCDDCTRRTTSTAAAAAAGCRQQPAGSPASRRGNKIWKFSIRAKFKNLPRSRRRCRVQDMYYAGNGVFARKEEGRRKPWGGVDAEEERRWWTRKEKYVCDVCGGHYEEPGVVARQRLSTSTYSHHPRPTPKPPYTLPPSLVRLMAHSFFLDYPARRLPSMAHCSTTSTLILIPCIVATFKLPPS